MSQDSLVDADALRRARLAAGLTQGEVARRLGLASGGVVYNWERGRYVPKEPTLELVADLLGVSVENLLVSGVRDLRRLRTLAGVTVGDLAESIGVASATVRRWELGQFHRGLNRAVVAAVADRLGVTPADVRDALACSAGQIS